MFQQGKEALLWYGTYIVILHPSTICFALDCDIRSVAGAFSLSSCKVSACSTPANWIQGYWLFQIYLVIFLMNNVMINQQKRTWVGPEKNDPLHIMYCTGKKKTCPKWCRKKLNQILWLPELHTLGVKQLDIPTFFKKQIWKKIQCLLINLVKLLDFVQYSYRKRILWVMLELLNLWNKKKVAHAFV